jgi:hypothetical protein
MGLGMGAIAVLVVVAVYLLFANSDNRTLPIQKPVNFQFSYPHGEFAGIRNWRYSSDGTWKEYYAQDARFTQFKESGRTTLNGCQGTVVARVAAPTFNIFIPDKDCKKMWLYDDINQAGWTFLGEMKSVE